MGWAIALHGGAGSISRDIPTARKEEAEAALRHCLDMGVTALRSSTSALDVVELVVRELENIPIFNAGRGSVLTTEGTVEMEACIMDGVTKNCGAVSGLSTVLNPISLARLVMEETPHIYLAFDGAERFAREQGVQTVDMNYFITEANRQRLEQAKAANIPMLDHTSEKPKDEIQINCPIGETVGCVAVDSRGHCAAATSTGGFVNKMVGRIGDTPIIGAGTYADSMCAVSATGKGEFIIRGTVARDVAALVEFRGLSLTEAANEVIEKRVQEGTAGLVAVSSNGEIAVALNTSGMYRACADESGFSQVGIWH